MDFTHFQTLLSSLQTKPEKIRTLVEYILLNSSSSEQEVGMALQKAFNSMNIEKKLAIFFTVSEILLISSQKREVVFFKVFGNKLKPFLESLSVEVKDVRVMRDVCRTLDKWQSEEMFAGNFMEKLKASVQDFYTKVRQENNQEERLLGFKKYKKTFLMEINDLRNYQTSYEVYQNHCEYLEIQQKLTNLNLQFSKLDFEKGSENTEFTKRRCQEMLKMYNDLREKLENCLVKIQYSFNSMRDWAMEEFEYLKRESAGSSGEFNKKVSSNSNST